MSEDRATLRCPRCSAIVEAHAFPGGRARCACGQAIDVPRITNAASAYREAAVAAADPAEARCKRCGERIASGARRCEACAEELDVVRCTKCWDIAPVGESHCRRCGSPRQPEIIGEEADESCPRCRGALRPAAAIAEAPSTGLALECSVCGGCMLTPDAVGRIVERAADVVWAHELGEPPAARRDPVKYLSCPMCNELMRRKLFVERSGVVVDECPSHGTWFDAGEITRAAFFVAQAKKVAATPADAPDLSPEAARAIAEAEAMMRLELARSRAKARHVRHMAELARRNVGAAVDDFSVSPGMKLLLRLLFG